ncbi:DUF3871 family protein [Phocaeicola coprophilus]|uniref:DUF3871 family protein n=1 Tax=Phocaeicola coprophilus TaxID=387090 RepID=UPI003993D1CD
MVIESTGNELIIAPDEMGNHPNFIESNTSAITLEELTNKNIIPTFCDNTLTISHQNFIGAVSKVAEQIFGELTPVECRVSHPIIGRVPSAQNKKASELREDEKTVFYQRLAWVAHARNLTNTINGQTVNLCIGGVRAYNEDKLYRPQTPMKFKIFVGWKVRVCSNLCLTCDGFSGTIECMTEADIMQKASELFSGFNPRKEETLGLLENLQSTEISEELFCKIIGRLRLYQFLPVNEQKALPSLNIGDQAVNTMVKGYVSNPNFGKKEGEIITCWNLLQLANEAVKSSYIDTWLDRNRNCTDFALGIQQAIEGNDTEGYSWFLN